jgi:hypothetical protein
VIRYGVIYPSSLLLSYNVKTTGRQSIAGRQSMALYLFLLICAAALMYFTSQAPDDPTPAAAKGLNAIRWADADEHLPILKSGVRYHLASLNLKGVPAITPGVSRGLKTKYPVAS